MFGAEETVPAAIDDAGKVLSIHERRPDSLFTRGSGYNFAEAVIGPIFFEH